MSVDTGPFTERFDIVFFTYEHPGAIGVHVLLP
jgi:hypothetical protein